MKFSEIVDQASALLQQQGKDDLSGAQASSSI